MSEDDPTENVQEDIHHRAHRAPQRWINFAALTAALLAALAAVAGAIAQNHLTASSRDQISSNDQWGWYQGKSIKGAVLQTKIDLLKAVGKQPTTADTAQLEEYDRHKNKIQEDAKKLEERSKKQLECHEVFEHGVTMFHIGIAMVAIAVLVKRRELWFLSMACGAVGLYFFIHGVMLSV